MKIHGQTKDSIPLSNEGDDKNIRRRVYDAFNVLQAVGIISKEGKSIVWRGFPGAASRRRVRVGGDLIEQVQQERAKRAEAIEKKQQQLRELVEHHRMVKQLIEVNPVRGPNETDIALEMPFVLVKVRSLGDVGPVPSDAAWPI